MADEPRCHAIRDTLIQRVLADWDPALVARTLAYRASEKRLMSQWAKSVEPAESYLWKVKMEDNWLSEAE